MKLQDFKKQIEERLHGRPKGCNRNEYWFEQIRDYGSNSPVLVLVNIRTASVLIFAKIR